LKLDVNGDELDVLKGALKTLPQVSAVLAEVNLIDIHRGAPLLDELVRFMRWWASSILRVGSAPSR